MKNRVFLMAAVLSVGMMFPMNADASSYMAGEALVEEENEQDTSNNTENGKTNKTTGNKNDNTTNNATSQITDSEEQVDDIREDSTKSSDADLKKLVIEPGVLTPEFSADVTDYTFVLEDNNMNQVLLTTKTKSKKAEVIAVSGFTNLKIGDNLAVLTVKAEDGTTKSYHVTITRNQGEVEAETVGEAAAVSAEGYIQTGQDNLVVHKEFEDQLLPEGCVKVEYSYKGHYVDAAYFEEGELILLYASLADGSNENFYVYYSGSDEYFKFVPFESSNGLLVFPVQYPTGIPIPNYFIESSIDFNGTVIAGYTVSESLFEEEEEYTDMEIEEEEATYILPEFTEYFLFFGISSDGNKGWYLYDMIENTCQRYLDLTTDVQENIFDEESYVVYKEKSQQRMVAICVLIFIILIFVGITFNQFLKIRELKSELPDDDDDDDPDHSDDGDGEEDAEDADEEDKPKRKAKSKFLSAEKAAKAALNEAQTAKPKQKQPAQTTQKPASKKVKPEPKPAPKPESKPEPKPEQKPTPKPQLTPDLDDDFEFEFIDISR